MKIGVNNKGLLIGLVITVVVLIGGSGYLIWRVNQKDTLAPTDSDASEENCVDRCTGPCTRKWPFEPPDQCTDDSYKGCTGWATDVGEFQGCCTYEHDCEITAYYITYGAGSGGTVTNSGQNNVAPGGSISSTATPNAGYRFVKWSDDKTTALRTDSNVSADATYTATFEASQAYTLTYSVAPYTPGGIVGGTLNGNLNQTVNQGQDGTEVTFVGNEGSYCKGSILEWLVNGVKDTTVTGNTRQEKNVQSNMTIVGKTGFVWTTDNTTFRYYTGSHGQIKLGDGTPSIDPITLTFTNGQPCPGDISITAIPSNGYIFSHWNDTILNTRDTSSLATANPRTDIISSNSMYKPNISVTAVFVPSSSCGDGVCSNGENSTNCPRDCNGTVPQTGIFDNSRNIIITGILFLIIGISWTYISTLSTKTYQTLSSTSQKIKEDASVKRMLTRREKLEKRIDRRK